MDTVAYGQCKLNSNDEISLMRAWNLQFVFSRSSGNNHKTYKKKKTRWQTDGWEDRETDELTDRGADGRAATITGAIWEGQRQLRALNWPPFSQHNNNIRSRNNNNNNTSINKNNHNTNNNCSHSTNAANCCLSRSCSRRIAKRMKAKQISALFTEVLCIVEHLNGQ